MKPIQRKPMRRLRIGVDVDDVLLSCIPHALSLAKKAGRIHPDTTEESIYRWGRLGTETDVIFDYFDNTAFYASQPVKEGAEDFLKWLMEVADVFLITAVKPAFMGLRARQIARHFPFFPEDHILMGARKDLIQLDVLFDDGAHNILLSDSTYPVLFRRPWNRHMTGCLAVTSFQGAKELVRLLLQEEQPDKTGHRLFVLLGSSGSGKTAAIEYLEREKNVQRIISYTTRNPRPGERNGTDYHFISEEQFNRMKRDGTFCEHTVYGTHQYGSTLPDIRKALQNSHAVMALDACGALSVKAAFGRQVTLVYLNRDKESLLRALLRRGLPEDETVNRILALSDEKKNAVLCDVVLENNGTKERLYRQLDELF